MTRGRRNALIGVLLLGNLILIGVVAYQVANNEQLSSQNTSAQREVSSLQQEIALVKSNISSMTAQNNNLRTSISALNATVESMGAQSRLLQLSLEMQNSTILVSTKAITVWPVIPGTPYSGPNMTFVLNFTAKYAGYLIIRSNITTDAFVTVQTSFPACYTWLGICETFFSPTINGYLPPLVPVLPGVVTVEVGSNAPIAPQHAWISIEYVT